MSLDAVYFRIADDLMAIASQVMNNDAVGVNPKIGVNTLANSQLREDIFASVSQTNSEDVVVKALFNNYVEYIERGRAPMSGHKPPIKYLKDWAEKNGIPTDASTLYAISYAIWRDGIQGRPIFATMDKYMDNAYNDEWAPALRDALLENLDKLFND